MNSDIPVQALSSSSISLCQVSTWPKLCKHNSSQPRNPQNLSCRTLPLPFSVLFNHQMFYLLKQLEMFISVFSTSPIFSLSFFILIHNLSHIHTQIPVKMLSSYYLFPPKFQLCPTDCSMSENFWKYMFFQVDGFFQCEGKSIHNCTAVSGSIWLYIFFLKLKNIKCKRYCKFYIPETWTQDPSPKSSFISYNPYLSEWKSYAQNHPSWYNANALICKH